MQLFSLALAVGSLILLGVNVLGKSGWAFRRGGRTTLPESDGADKSSIRCLGCFALSLPRVEKVGSEAFFVALSERLTGRFHHGEGRFNVWSDYLSWIASFCIGRFRTIENSVHLFRYSRHALCHQIAQAMVDVAGCLGQKARVLGLDGHVVAEGYYEGGWHGFDPDYGVVYRHAGRILSVEEVAASPEIAAELYREHRFRTDSRQVLEILAKGQITHVAPSAHLSPRTAQAQRLLHAFRWVIPATGLLTAALLSVFE
jgi:hypothetical protein